MLARLLGLAALTALPLTGLIGYHHLDEYQRLNAAAHAEALQHSHTIAHEYDRLLTGAQHLLVAMSRRNSVRTRDADACRTTVTDLVAEVQTYSALAAFDLTGRPFCASYAIPPNESVATRDFFRQALATGGLALGSAVRGRGTGRLQLPAAVPFAGPDGEIAGVVMALIDLEWISRFVAQHAGGGAAPAVVIADRNGTVIVRTPPLPDPTGRQLTPPLLPPLQDVLAATKAGTVVGAGMDGVRRIWAYSPLAISPKDLFVSAGIDEAAALAAVNRTIARSLAVSLGLLVLALAIGVGGGWLLLRDRLASPDVLPQAGPGSGFAVVTQLTREARASLAAKSKRSG